MYRNIKVKRKLFQKQLHRLLVYISNKMSREEKGKTRKDVVNIF